MKILIAAVIAALITTVAVNGQVERSKLYTIFDGEGNRLTFEDLISRLGTADVVFLGEYHDDSVGHAFQAEVFRAAYEKYQGERSVALSLEMFESDVQYILDEYLSGKITEDHFLASGRPWKNYKTDYRPLVEFAKENRLSVIAANAPRRYVNMVSRNGRGSLDSLSKQAKKTLAPLPFGESSEAYSAKFRNLMSAMPAASGGSSRIDNILQSQTLWDATMAWWISRHLKKNKKALVVHLNGGFHTESRLGTPEHLSKYRKKSKSLVVTIRYEKDYGTFDPEKHKGIGDFVVLTDASQPRSGK
ncbi:MAG: ChaN family lipoprotein [Acidobacteriota bacterium]|nr:MAG: ChaN family lipoprotein [Acidobacteriota bacterium]